MAAVSGRFWLLLIIYRGGLHPGGVYFGGKCLQGSGSLVDEGLAAYLDFDQAVRPIAQVDDGVAFQPVLVAVMIDLPVHWVRNLVRFFAGKLGLFFARFLMKKIARFLIEPFYRQSMFFSVSFGHLADFHLAIWLIFV